MSEGIPKSEEHKSALKQSVIERLKAKPENLAPLHEYLDMREGQVKNAEETLQLNIEVAEIYRDAGIIEGAKEAFRDAEVQAFEQRDDGRYQYCIDELRKLEGDA